MFVCVCWLILVEDTRRIKIMLLMFSTLMIMLFLLHLLLLLLLLLLFWAHIQQCLGLNPCSVLRKITPRDAQKTIYGYGDFN